MLRQFGTFIAWLSGSLAGIGAALYALGFVATIGSDQLLGISSEFASRGPDFYIGRGGSLVIRTVLLAIWPVVGLILFATACRWICARLSQRKSLVTARRLATLAVAPSTAVAMLVIALSGLYVLKPALSMEGLLFTEHIPADICKENDSLGEAILSQEHGVLNVWFDWFALGAGTLVGLAVIARTHLVSQGQSPWLAIACVAGLLTLVILPVAYGVMVAEFRPPEILIDPAPADDQGRTRLLARIQGGLLVWLETQRRVRWISSDRVDAFTIGPDEPVASLSCDDPGVSAGGSP